MTQRKLLFVKKQTDKTINNQKTHKNKNAYIPDRLEDIDDCL